MHNICIKVVTLHYVTEQREIECLFWEIYIYYYSFALKHVAISNAEQITFWNFPHYKYFPINMKELAKIKRFKLQRCQLNDFSANLWIKCSLVSFILYNGAVRLDKSALQEIIYQ